MYLFDASAGIMAFVARLQNAAPSNGYIDEDLISRSRADRVDAAPPPAVELAVIDTATGSPCDGEVNRVCVAHLKCSAPILDKTSVQAEINSPSARILPASINWSSDESAEIRFTPYEAGLHTVQVRI